MQNKIQEYKSGIIRTFLIIVFLISWELYGSSSDSISFYISYPSKIAEDLLIFAKEGDLAVHALTTAMEAYSGLVYGIILGVTLGLLFSQFKLFGKTLVPIIYSLQSIPQLTLAPLYILWFGIGFLSKVVLSTTMVFFTLFFSTYNGIKSIDQKLIESATVLGANTFQILTKIVIPCTMPGIMSGIRSGSRICMVGAIVGEYIGASKGLGWMITYASSFFQISRVMSSIAILLILGVLVDWIIGKIEKRVLMWRPEVRLSMEV